MSNAKDKNNKKVKTGNYLKEVLSGSMVTDKIVLKNLWYLLLLTLLGALYIGNRFHAEKVTRETARLTREIKDMRAESLTTSTELMYASKQSEVFRMVREKGLGLEELKTPPYRLVVDKK